MLSLYGGCIGVTRKEWDGDGFEGYCVSYKDTCAKQCKSTSVGYLLHVLHVVQRNTLVAIENL